jgi:hypothetical protein
MLKTEYLEQRLDQIVCDAFYEGAEMALSINTVKPGMFNYSKAKIELLRLMTEIIQSDGE